MIPQTLINRIKEGKVIPFIGAGVSMSALDMQGNRLFPSWGQLLEHAGEKLKQENKPNEAGYVAASLGIDDRDLLKTAEYAKKHLGACWYDLLKEQLDPRREMVDDKSLILARQIWEMGSDLVISTNYDRVLEWSCPDRRKGDYVGWNIQATAEQAELLKNGGVNRPTVWHLHGKITDASNLILTPDGYTRLYDQNNEVSYKAALHTLRSLLASHTMLFIGFSMDDPYVGVQLKGIQDIFDCAAGPHYVLVREQDRLKLQRSGLKVEPVAFTDFGEPLIELLKELSSHQTGPTSMLPKITSQPTIAKPPHIRPGTQGPADYNPANRVFNVPFRPKGDQVIGRDDALQQVRDQLTQGKHTAIGHTAAFEGLGGLGKTQLAVEYAYRFNDLYPNGVIWINADQDINAQLTDIAVSARWIAPETEHKLKLDVALHRLRSFSDSLIIFDNVDDHAAIEPFLPLPTATPHLLATSRTALTGFKAIHLNQLDEGQSLQLLFQEAGRQAVGDDETEAAKKIVEQLDGLPLALELAGAYLCHRSTMSFIQYRDKLLSDPIKTLNNQYLDSFTKHDADLFRTLKIDEDVVLEEPLLVDILDILTWSGPAAMGFSLMATLLDKKESELFGALALGTQLKLIQKNADEELYALHRLVREVRRFEQPLEGREEWVYQVCAKLGDWFEGLREDFLELPRFEAEIDHLVAWRDNAEHKAPLHSCRLTWLQAYPAYHRGMFREAQSYVLRSKDMYDNTALSDAKLLANVLSDLGTTYGFMGEHRNALKYHFSALELRQNALGERHPDTATTYNSIGYNYGQLGEYRKCLEYEQRALEIRCERLGEHHADTATSYQSIGSCYSDLGEYRKALENQEKALEIFRGLFEERHPRIASIYYNIGNSYDELGKDQTALEYQEKALDIRLEFFGERHPVIASSYNSIGNSYNSLQEHSKALGYYEKASKISRELLGERHPDTATTYNNIGETYSILGEDRTALEYQEKALEIRREFWGESHPDIASSYNSIGNSYGNLEDNQTALKYKEKALRVN